MPLLGPCPKGMLTKVHRKAHIIHDSPNQGVTEVPANRRMSGWQVLTGGDLASRTALQTSRRAQNHLPQRTVRPRTSTVPRLRNFVVHPPDGIVCSNEKEQTINTCNCMTVLKSKECINTVCRVKNQPWPVSLRWLGIPYTERL